MFQHICTKILDQVRLGRLPTNCASLNCIWTEITSWDALYIWRQRQCALKTQHMLCFWKAGVQVYQIWQSDQSSPQPAPSTPFDDLKWIYTVQYHTIQSNAIQYHAIQWNSLGTGRYQNIKVTWGTRTASGVGAQGQLGPNLVPLDHIWIIWDIWNAGYQAKVCDNHESNPV